MKINTGVTERGFACGMFTDSYGTSCSVQKSSLANKDALWLGVHDADPQIMTKDAEACGLDTEGSEGWMSYPLPASVFINTRMHLDRDQVAALLPILQLFVDTGDI